MTKEERDEEFVRRCQPLLRAVAARGYPATIAEIAAATGQNKATVGRAVAAAVASVGILYKARSGDYGPPDDKNRHDA